MRRLVFGLISVFLLAAEILIGMFAHGWLRIYFGDVLVVILIYTVIRTVIPYKRIPWFVLPSVILVFAFGVEFLQLWGFCDRLGITNRLLRIIIGTGFSVKDLACYLAGIIPCCVTEFLIAGKKQDGQRTSKLPR